MSWNMQKTLNLTEEIVEDKGVKVLIDPKAIMYLIGTEMDYKKEKFSSQFIFKNLTRRSVVDVERSLKNSAVIHLKFYWMRCMLKFINFLKF